MNAANRVSAEQAGRRVEEVLDRLAAGGDRAAAEAAEELVRSLMDFYGSGLARIVRLLSAGGGRRPRGRPPGGRPRGGGSGGVARCRARPPGQ
ncbi:hypothetical protein ABT085_41950, partial [Streptomyces sp. NPDC002265]